MDADLDETQDWLVPGEVNCGYALHPDARGNGYATRALMLLLHHLAQATDARTATLSIDFDNRWSLAIAQRCGFEDHGVLPNTQTEVRFFKKPVPPLTYTDGVVTIRLRQLDDVEAHVAGTDEEQIRWLWPEHREDWLAKSHEEQVAHVRGVFERNIATNETGPKWDFGVWVDGVLVGHVDCDLANPNVPHGEANISYTVWPEHRGKGYAAAAARLVMRFVAEHTGAREVHIEVDPENVASLRVAHAVGAVETERTAMVRHVIELAR